MSFTPSTKIGSLFDKILRVLFVLACVLLIFVMLSVCLEIVMRYFVGRPQSWVVEISSYSLLFITFLSAGWVLRREGHVKIDLVLDLLSPRLRFGLNTITSVLSALMWLVITWYAGEATWDMYQTSERICTILEPLKYPLFAIIPVGSFILFIQSLRRTFGYVDSYKEGLHAGETPRSSGS